MLTGSNPVVRTNFMKNKKFPPFKEMLLICLREGLILDHLFAKDGSSLPVSSLIKEIEDDSEIGRQHIKLFEELVKQEMHVRGTLALDEYIKA